MEMDEDDNLIDLNIDEDGRPIDIPLKEKTARERKKEKGTEVTSAINIHFRRATHLLKSFQHFDIIVFLYLY